jgi:hypothetical protein
MMIYISLIATTLEIPKYSSFNSIKYCTIKLNIYMLKIRDINKS